MRRVHNSSNEGVRRLGSQLAADGADGSISSAGIEAVVDELLE